MGTEVLRPQDCLRPTSTPAPAPFPRAGPNQAKNHRGRKRREGKGGAAARAAADDRAVYAGTAFWMSPAPSALPIPNFSKREDGRSPAPAVGIDYTATRDLRRLLRID